MAEMMTYVLAGLAFTVAAVVVYRSLTAVRAGRSRQRELDELRKRQVHLESRLHEAERDAGLRDTEEP